MRAGTIRLRSLRHPSDIREYSRVQVPGACWLPVAVFDGLGLVALAVGIGALFARHCIPGPDPSRDPPFRR
jgi:hypothetical protein